MSVCFCRVTGWCFGKEFGIITIKQTNNLGGNQQNGKFIIKEYLEKVSERI